MSFYGGNQNGGQPGSNPQQQMGRQPTNPGLQNVQQVLTPQLFNINVNPSQLHNFFNEHGSSQNSLQLTAAAAAANQSILLQSQQQQSFPVNLINDVGQLISSATVSQSQMQGLPISMSSALNFPQALQVHGQTAQSQQSQAQNQQSKQRVFTGTVTKVHDNFGFIDEEVFFQMGVVKGPILPKEGDRVLVEADFNSNMPFKWNATRVQIVNIGGGMSSSLNNLQSMGASQQQHMGFGASVGMQKPTSAAPPPVLTSQPNNARPHGPQPVTIVSNPHSVYSSASNPRGRTANVVGAPVPAPAGPMSSAQRDPKRPLGHMPMAPDPPAFLSNSPMGGLMSSDRDLDRDNRGRERERSRERGRDRTPERSRDHVRDRSRDRVRGRSRERDRSRDRGRDRSKERVPRNRSRSRERVARDRSRERSRERNGRGNSRERLRERSLERSLPLRGRSRSRDRSARDVSADKRDKGKRERERTPERRDRSTRDKDKKRSPSPAIRSRKEDVKKEDKPKDKDRSTADRGKTTRDKSPSGQSQSQASERTKRSRSRESVRTDRGHGHGPTERSRSRSTSPRRKAVRSVARYAVEIPKFSLDMKDLGTKELQRRYPNLYVPSDFFLAKSTWMDTFPMHQPFDLGHPCPVQIMRKGVQKIEIPNVEELEDSFKSIPDVLEPPDASFIFKAKVMIPSLNSLETIYRKACSVADNPADIPDSPQGVDRLISFIVGMKTSKHEIMALGGPWSPSLDGPNPQSDPQTLINTAIRSVRALTGLNLSRCKNWYRFMELYYKRTNCLETVVFYLPDVWSCLPGNKEWNKLRSVYKFALFGDKVDVADKNVNNVKADKEAISISSSKGSEENNSSKGSSAGDALKSAAGTESVADQGENGVKLEENTDNQEDDVLNNSGLLVIDEAPPSPTREDGAGEDIAQETASVLEAAIAGVTDGTNASDAAAMETEEKRQLDGLKVNTTEDSALDEKATVEVDKTNGDGERILEPTHFSALTPKNMTVVQLKDELTRRSLSAKGLKSQLTTRLVKALKDEEAQEKENELNVEPLKDKDSVTGKMDVENKGSEEPCDIDPKEEEHDIRIVNSSLIFETQDDEMSIEDGELKEEHSAQDASVNAEYMSILAKFPSDTFPIIKPGMKDEDLKMWERRYTLPKNPRLLVYPSTSVKSGNFDCLSMTLGLLRDYRIIDKKEDNFEVSLFSEFFHEMLQRDFAFKIYCEIIAEAQRPSTEETPSEKEEGESRAEKTEKESGEPTSKKRKLSNTTGNTSNQPAKKTTDPFLLLSFIFFDVTHCGYITETDLEDLCGSIGLGLTRSQIRKAVQKVAHKGTLYYRKWTDRPEKPNGLSDYEIKTLSLGNKAYFPVFVLQDNIATIHPSKSEVTEDANEAVIAVVDGKEVDVKKLMEQFEKLEKDLTVADSSLNVMKNSLNESKSQVTDLKKSNESLKDELAKIKEALKKSEISEKSAKESLEVFRRSTERFMDRVKDFVKLPSPTNSKERIEPSSKIKEKVHAEPKEKSKPNHDSNNSESNQDPVNDSSTHARGEKADA